MCDCRGVKVNNGNATKKVKTYRVVMRTVPNIEKHITGTNSKSFSWGVAGSPRVRSMVGHVVVAKPTLLTIC